MNLTWFFCIAGIVVSKQYLESLRFMQPRLYCGTAASTAPKPAYLFLCCFSHSFSLLCAKLFYCAENSMMPLEVFNCHFSNTLTISAWKGPSSMHEARNKVVPGRWSLTNLFVCHNLLCNDCIIVAVKILQKKAVGTLCAKISLNIIWRLTWPKLNWGTVESH